MKLSFIILIIVIVHSGALAQTEFFHEISLSKTLYSQDKKTIYTIMPSWKHIYDDIGWRKWSLLGQVKRQYNNWYIGGGFGGFYTFDKDIQNNLELRPFAVVSLKNAIINKMMLTQSLKYEWRYFIYSNKEYNFNTSRLRYNLNIVTVIHENLERKTNWKLRNEVEWYLLKSNNIRERFINSTEYALMFLREIGKVEWGIGYRIERFNRNFLVDDPNGHTVVVEVNF